MNTPCITGPQKKRSTGAQKVMVFPFITTLFEAKGLPQRLNRQRKEKSANVT